MQLTYKYWEEHFGTDPFEAVLKGLVYALPQGCGLAKQGDINATMCPEDSFPPEEDKGPYAYKGEWLCQYCDPNEGGQPWTYADWIFTGKVNIFGLIPGYANPTGVYLMIIMIILFVCSLPFIRRRGHFEIFYFSHLLYWAYFACMILHAPNYWKWIIGPGLIWIAEMSYRVISYLFGAGKTVIKAGIVLPSKVTELIIERPPGFNFSAGDWVFIKIPAVASSEWHPFTISSAPEVTVFFCGNPAVARILKVKCAEFGFKFRKEIF